MTSLRLFETSGVLIAQHTRSYPSETRPPGARYRRSRWPYDASVLLHAVALISVVSMARHRAQPPLPAGSLANVANAGVLLRPAVDNSGHHRPARTQRPTRVPAVIADEEPPESAFDPPTPDGRRASLQGYDDPSEAGSFDGASAGGGPTPPRIQQPLPIPDYPTDARIQRLQGVVVLEVMLDTFGKAHVRGVLSRPLGFGIEDAARNAAERLKFTPARQDGRAVDAIVQVRVTFTLAEDDETAVTGGA